MGTGLCAMDIENKKNCVYRNRGKRNEKLPIDMHQIQSSFISGSGISPVRTFAISANPALPSVFP